MNLPLFLFMMSVLFTFVAMSMQHRHGGLWIESNRQCGRGLEYWAYGLILVALVLAYACGWAGHVEYAK